ncbi:MAG: hypothetical protein IJG94_07910 [Clostridia bacterium]|jgi:hypothetical protein|nr:hypothetical protein [Clostridia bacterium]
MDYKKLAPLFSALGVIVFFVWGALGNGWGKSWIAICVGGILSGLCYTLAGQEKKNDKKDE